MKPARLLLSAFLLTSACAHAAEPPSVVVRPTDHGGALVNPGMGWTFVYYSNNKIQSSFIVEKKSGDSRISLGEYGVFVSVGLREASPRFALPLSDGDGDLRYRVGTIRLTD